MTLTAEKKLNLFLGFLVVSLVGNACADFALIWHSVANIGESKSFLSSIYIGQALGIVLLAPMLSLFVDRVSRRRASVGLDLAYASLLALLIGLDHFGLLSPGLIFPIVMVTASLGSLHRSAIGLGALKELSQELGVSSIVAKYQASLFFTNLIGSAVSGVLYSQLGLQACLLLAIATFLPMPFIYLKIFKRSALIETNARPITVRSFLAGWQFLYARKSLRWITICAAVVNFASNIFPGLVALSFRKIYPNNSDFASYAISASILVGVIAYKPALKVSEKYRLNQILPIALGSAIVLLLASAFFPNPFLFTLAFAAQCAGAALINVVSGSLRVQLIPKEQLAQANTSYQAVIYSGQVVGAFVLIPLMEWTQTAGALGVFAAFILAALIGAKFLPKIKLQQEMKS